MQINVFYKTKQDSFLLCIDIRHILTLRRLHFSPRVVHVGLLRKFSDGALVRYLNRRLYLHRVLTLGV
jgi:hypothetical protein